MNKLKAGINRLTTILITAAGILAGLSALMSTINALFRKIASFSFSWAEELCTYAVVVAAFMAIPYLEWKCKQLSVDLLSNSLKNKPKVLRGIRILSSIIIIIVSCIIAWFGWKSSMTAIETHITTFVLQWPRAIYFIIVVVCFVIIIIVSILSIFLDGSTDISDKINGNPDLKTDASREGGIEA